MKPFILIILGSTRDNSMGSKVSAWFTQFAQQRGDAQYQLVEVKGLNLATFNEAGSPKQIEHSYTDPHAQAWVKQVEGADGFVIITPEYNHGYPSGLKNSLDYVYAGWNNKPVAFVSYGGVSGGIRAVEQLRQVAIALQLAPINESLTFPFINKLFSPEGKLLDTSADKRAGIMLDQLLWWTVALHEGRKAHSLT